MSVLLRLALLPLSVFVVVGSFALMFIGLFIAVVLMPFGVPFRRSHRFAGGLFMGLCPRLTLSRFEIHFDPAFDKERRSVFVQNHVSILDGHIACMTIPHAFCGLHLAWHFKIPAYGWIMKLADGIPVYPHRAGHTAGFSEAAKDRVFNKNISILVFPEAHRTRDGKVHEFRRGVFFMARDAGIPVVPLAVRGLFEVNSAKSLMFRPGVVQIYVGPQIETKGLLDDEVRELAQRVRDITARFVDTGRPVAHASLARDDQETVTA